MSTTPTAALVIETAAAAGLLAERADADGNPVWVPTDTFDVWSGRDLAERWLTLARAWLESPRMPSLVGTRDSNGKPRNALSPDLAGPTMVEARSATPRAARRRWRPARCSPPAPASRRWSRRVAWQRPRRPRIRDDQVAWTVAESGDARAHRARRAGVVRPRADRPATTPLPAWPRCCPSPSTTC